MIQTCMLKWQQNYTIWCCNTRYLATLCCVEHALAWILVRPKLRTPATAGACHKRPPVLPVPKSKTFNEAPPAAESPRPRRTQPNHLVAHGCFRGDASWNKTYTLHSAEGARLLGFHLDSALPNSRATLPNSKKQTPSRQTVRRSTSPGRPAEHFFPARSLFEADPLGAVARAKVLHSSGSRRGKLSLQGKDFSNVSETTEISGYSSENHPVEPKPHPRGTEVSCQ